MSIVTTVAHLSCCRAIVLLFTAWVSNIIHITNWFRSPYHALLRRCSRQLAASDVAASFGSRLMTCSTVVGAAVLSVFIHVTSSFTHLFDMNRLTICLINWYGVEVHFCVIVAINGPFVYGGTNCTRGRNFADIFLRIVSKLWDFMTLLGHLFPKHWFKFYVDVL